MARALQNETDYGRFISNELFGRLFPNYESDHERAAGELVSRVFSQCHGQFDYPRIDTLVDLGCGDGRFLLNIRKEVNKYNNREEIKDSDFKIPIARYIGLDVSKAVIRQAIGFRKKFCRDKGAAQFKQIGKGVSQLQDIFDKNKEDRADPKSTALLILSHTWFHFQDQIILLEAIKRIRPALIILDVFHSWDATIRELQKPQKNAESKPVIHEPISVDGAALRTEVIDGQSVKRGVYQTRDNAHGEKTGWLFETKQIFKTTDWLFGSKEECESLESARVAGKLTGRNECDYVRCQQFVNFTGWGPMDCHVLIGIDPIARILNEAFYSVIKRVFKETFVLGNKAGFFDFFRNLKVDPNKPNGNLRCEAAVVLPFDQHRSFARFIAIDKRQDDTAISANEAIIELPERSQRNYPTAYGLYHTMVCRVSSMQAFPLCWTPNYEHADVDVKFATLENALLGLGGPKIQEKSPSFFIVPLYFGSLPLFALFLESPSNFPAETSDAAVYQATLRNLHDQIKLRFTDEFVRNQIITPFLAKALDALQRDYNRRHAEERNADSCKTLEDYFNHIRTFFDGEQKYNNPLKGDNDEVTRRKRKRKKDYDDKPCGVLEQLWKSWLLTTPSFPIKDLEATKAENRILIRLFAKEAERVLLDHELQLSYWFQEGCFFDDCDCRRNGRENCDGGAHDNWCPNMHYARLDKMLQLVGANGKDLNSLSYFNRSHNHYLLMWLDQEIQALRKLQNTSENSHKALTDIYRDLKGVFCKNLENRGNGFRFGTRRLYCVLKAAAGQTSIQPKSSKQIKHLRGHVEDNNTGLGKYISQNDPTLHIADIVNTLANGMKVVKNVNFETNEDDRIAITINLNEELLPKEICGGQKFSQLKIACDSLGITSNKFCNSKSIVLSLKVSKDGQGVGSGLKFQLE